MAHNLLETLNVRMVGNGEQIIVLAHGFGTEQSVWQRILPFISHDHRIVLFDLACAGSVNYEYFDRRRYITLDAYVDDLLNILDTLGITSCTYVGHSVSATIGLLASIRRPNLFNKLILICFTPSVLNDPINNYHGGLQQEDVDAVIAAMESNYEAWRHGAAPLLVGADVPEAVQEFSRTLFNMRPDITLFVSRMAFGTDYRGILGSVTVPCSIIQPTRDVNVPASVATYVRNRLGGPSTLHLLNIEGHIPHLSAPNLLAQELRRALPRNVRRR